VEWAYLKGPPEKGRKGESPMNTGPPAIEYGTDSHTDWNAVAHHDAIPVV